MLRRRAHLVLAVLALTLGARLAAAGTSLWVRSDPDDPVGGGVERAFGSALADVSETCAERITHCLRR